MPPTWGEFGDLTFGVFTPRIARRVLNEHRMLIRRRRSSSDEGTGAGGEESRRVVLNYRSPAEDQVDKTDDLQTAKDLAFVLIGEGSMYVIGVLVLFWLVG